MIEVPVIQGASAFGGREKVVDIKVDGKVCLLKEL